MVEESEIFLRFVSGFCCADGFRAWLAAGGKASWAEGTARAKEGMWAEGAREMGNSQMRLETVLWGKRRRYD